MNVSGTATKIRKTQNFQINEVCHTCVSFKAHAYHHTILSGLCSNGYTFINRNQKATLPESLSVQFNLFGNNPRGENRCHHLTSLYVIIQLANKIDSQVKPIFCEPFDSLYWPCPQKHNERFL